MNWIKKAWQGIEVKPKTAREFGFILSGFFFLAPLLANIVRVFIAHKEFHYWLGWLVLGTLALAVNLFLPQLMRLIYHFAMFVAGGISWVMMRFILGILFFLVFTPIGIVMHFVGKDILGEKIDKNAVTYWKKHEPRLSVDRYERLF